ncbi:MAG TPA: heterodisulfide reductase-related iron-sulfur binding cluster [Gammaproteobacteria bacterium]|nr:heterodisulfide reductase-related iron-sulfur binding cluster [Gammaproteobacteria bacterium]
MAREGSLEAPTRHPLDWRSESFYDKAALFAELERVYDICHGCRRCVSLCNSFPTLFDLVDESPTMEVDGVQQADYWKVVDQCYLCDLCYLTKCPYVPPHEWNVDFPHLMLRAKAVKFRDGDLPLRDKVLTSTDVVGRIATIPVVAQTVNAVNRAKPARALLQKYFGVHAEAPLPSFTSRTARKRLADLPGPSGTALPTPETTGKVAIFLTCYGNRNAPQVVEDLVAVLRHNDIEVRISGAEVCCGMPKLELGDLDTVARHKDRNVGQLLPLVEQGYDLIAAIPSCVLMFKQELPLMFPEDGAVQRLRKAFFDPFEYLMHRHRAGLFKTDFAQGLGSIAHHVPCHQRVQNIGLKTKDVLELVPGTKVTSIERCSGHDGTYAVKAENYAYAKKICAPVVGRITEGSYDHYLSDCPMAGELIEQGVAKQEATSAFSLLRQAYGI